ncbi:tyrosine-protein kinase Srms-like [Halichondria panicea]|uniref:tyrosine-protein kinase Srms-like n=1 Tax=Halichondria panicea TaxID=6063 RepID=UPI00312B85F3
MHNGDLLHHLSTLRQSVAMGDLPLYELKQLLMSFTRQVVSGLGYLSLKGFVHRDLAARNVLVSDEGICKIADFGLSRNLQNEEYYRSHGGKVPVKWTAPEAINYRKYSSASDVWSYGCVLYEIWTLGEKLFSHLTNTETIEAVISGERLPPPPGCPRPIYSIMIDCWHPDPECRPVACDLVTKLLRPDFIFLKWQASETSRYPEEAQTLGTALENGHCLHMDLQRRYCKGPSTHARKEKKELDSNTVYDTNISYNAVPFIQ